MTPRSVCLSSFVPPLLLLLHPQGGYNLEGHRNHLRGCERVWFNRSGRALRSFISNKSPGNAMLLVQGTHSENRSLSLDYMLVSSTRRWPSWGQGAFPTHLISRVEPVSSSHSINQQIFSECLVCARHCCRHWIKHLKKKRKRKRYIYIIYKIYNI